MPVKNKETKHEHFLRKSAVVSIISMLIISFGLLNVAIYDTGHVVAFSPGLAFWVALVTLAAIAILVDFVKSNLKKVFWVEDVVGGFFGAVAYYFVFAAFGVLTSTTITGFVFGLLVLFVLFYLGFDAGHWVDTEVLRKNGISIN
jgi:magnesium-transporting ATPase (P-type)